jgi:hypothetical protein
MTETYRIEELRSTPLTEGPWQDHPLVKAYIGIHQAQYAPEYERHRGYYY